MSGSTFDARSADGTVVRGWQSGGRGPVVVLSNGLGTVPSAWPALVAPDSGYDVVSWYYRGTFGTDRPADRSRVHVDDHVDDLVAVLDARGVERAVVACWSIGVNVAFELALRHPERVAGLLAVAGVPGDTFATMGGPWRVPRLLRRPIATRVARTGRAVGPLLTVAARTVPVGRTTAAVLTHTGVMSPAARPEVLVPMLREFLVQDWRWYMHLAVGASRHPRMDLSALRVPVTFLAGRHDVLTSMQDVLAAAERVPDAQVSVLPGTHFLPLEHPGLVQAALADLQARVLAA